MTVETQAQGHAVLFSYEAWGHIRPLCVLAAQIVKARPIHISFLTSARLLDRIEAEVSRSFSADDTTRNLIRAIAIPLEDGPQLLDVEGMNKSFADVYGKLVREEPVECAKTGRIYEAIPAPNTAIVDLFCNDPAKTVRKLSKRPVKVYDWIAGSSSFLLYPFGPTSKGGRGDRRPQVFETVEKTGRPINEVAEEIMLGIDGSIIKLPGIPPMYDYEHQPQEMMIKNIAGLLWIEAQGVLDECDGVILSSPECYEPEAVAAVREWFAETSREAFAVGPLLPISTSSSAIAGENQGMANAAEISSFLESTLETHGKGSMLYISFGSLFWSSEPEKIWAFLDVLIEKKIPFIMSHASPLAIVPDEVKSRVQESGVGLLSPWSPQQTILSHPVVGWFVTHSGQNSVTEAIASGVPMICWPFHADQPLNAVNLAHNLDVAYELIEVRNGDGLKPILRNGRTPVGTVEAVRKEVAEVLENAFGLDGERKRANMQKLREAMAAGWKEGGSARTSLHALADALRA
ncbi:hypothetical protein NLI96_g3563 [Meripilus lineatus]|uniref:Glycosyltransferase n=1 Tax=Meripilus lineatus TaxID=2056292 RepID=A0AAD5YKX9_9APHY|nr:hypothetical protein NLI96_g3563 [Physisporinus lineatus]